MNGAARKKSTANHKKNSEAELSLAMQKLKLLSLFSFLTLIIISGCKTSHVGHIHTDSVLDSTVGGDAGKRINQSMVFYLNFLFPLGKQSMNPGLFQIKPTLFLRRSIPGLSVLFPIAFGPPSMKLLHNYKRVYSTGDILFLKPILENHISD